MRLHKCACTEKCAGAFRNCAGAFWNCAGALQKWAGAFCAGAFVQAHLSPRPKPKAEPVYHTIPMVVVDRASAHLLPHSAVPTAAVPDSAHTRPRASRLYVAAHTLSTGQGRPRCRLRHCLAAAASLWNSKVVDPRQASQCFSPTGSRISARRCLAYLLSQLSPPTPLPRHWPHFTEGSPHRIAHTG